MSDTPRTDLAQIEGYPFSYVDADFSRYLERELVAARAELVETKKELNDKNKFCYAVEQALDGLKGDYVEIIKELRKDAEKYRYCFNAAIDAAMKEVK